MYISALQHGNRFYLARRSTKGLRPFLWSIMPVAPGAGETRIDVGEVPKPIRKAAYKVLNQKEEAL